MAWHGMAMERTGQWRTMARSFPRPLLCSLFFSFFNFSQGSISIQSVSRERAQVSSRAQDKGVLCMHAIHSRNRPGNGTLSFCEAHRVFGQLHCARRGTAATSCNYFVHYAVAITTFKCLNFLGFKSGDIISTGAARQGHYRRPSNRSCCGNQQPRPGRFGMSRNGRPFPLAVGSLHRTGEVSPS